MTMGMDQRFVVQGENTEGEIARFRKFDLLQTFFRRNYPSGLHLCGHCTRVNFACLAALRFEVGCYLSGRFDMDQAEFDRILDEIEMHLNKGNKVFYSANW
jgi:hypothetical protein